MRPSLLDPLFAPATVLPGVGPKLAKLFDRLLGEPDRPARVVDMLFHLPYSVVDRRVRDGLAGAVSGETGTFALTVEEHRLPPRTRANAPLRVICGDGKGSDVALVFFHGHAGKIESMLPVGARKWVSGKLELWDGRWQMVHPDRILDAPAAAALKPFEPVYSATEGLSQRVLVRAADAALARLPALPEWIDAAVAARFAFPSLATALKRLHNPDSPAAVDPLDPARRRVAYDELLASQLALLLVRGWRREEAGASRAGDGRLAAALAARLPFSLTASQQAAIADIRADLAKPKRMLRLLQGDVGSGKTVVALLAMASVAETGGQAALMAPTEILARQHAERIVPMLAETGIAAALLTGRDRASERGQTLAGLADGSIAVAIGTHALFQESVEFKDLALAVVDEQHRFGVHQRLALGRKGEAADMLVMTATPIPRTLVLTYFGDIDVSVLTEKPAGRQPIDTRAMPLDRLDEVTEAIRRALARGAQVYWVCPLVAESEELDVTAAENRFEELRQAFGAKVGLLHGQMPGPKKDAAMAAFARGDIRLLVATTVIEVGVDVPNATVMVIEHAERFGLAQLHQLRGRVGRGADRSTCLLLYKGPLGEVARARLQVLRDTEDGFRIAEEDLRLRGEGDLLGARQSGMPGFRLVRPELDGDLLETARQDAKRMLADDPGLTSERGRALRLLLHLFARDEAVRLLQAG